MNKRNQAKITRAKAKQQPNEPKHWRTYAMMVVCGLMLVSGFFFAGRQHFSSMDYGMKNARLRKQIDELEAEKRRLVLVREVSLSPSEIKKAAKKTGLTEAATEVAVIQTASTTREKGIPEPATTSKPMVIKTAAVTAAPPRVAAVYAKKEQVDRQARKPVFAE